jgi:hypothetical protein
MYLDWATRWSLGRRDSSQWSGYNFLWPSSYAQSRDCFNAQDTAEYWKIRKQRVCPAGSKASPGHTKTLVYIWQPFDLMKIIPKARDSLYLPSENWTFQQSRQITIKCDWGEKNRVWVINAVELTKRKALNCDIVVRCDQVPGATDYIYLHQMMAIFSMKTNFR